MNKRLRNLITLSLSQSFALFILTSAYLAFSSQCAATALDHAVAGNPARPGGKTTTRVNNHNAFSQAANNMPITRKLDFSVGNSFFRNPWVIAPSSTDKRDGLGPLYNTNGCQNCHVKDGRGHPPEFKTDNAVSLLVRLSIPATTTEQQQSLVQNGVIPEPMYGGQIQDFSIPGIAPEAKINITYENHRETFNDGHTVELRKPVLRLSQLAYGRLHPDTMTSMRIAPPMIGLGLLAAIPGQDLKAQADPNDSNHDGISGRTNQVWNIESKTTSLGRFGWKAGQPTLKQQSAGAFNGDLGVTSSLFPQENCGTKQHTCQQGISGGSPELTDNILGFVTFYAHNLAVPARRRSQDKAVLQGRHFFLQANCQACHTERFTTGSSPFPWLSKQVIFPYSDLLLHDMGTGLADNRPEFLADGREWRTPPLWGIGKTLTVGKKAYYLHDGRARSLMEAVLWHGGEAEVSKQYVLNMTDTERQSLIHFLESL